MEKKFALFWMPVTGGRANSCPKVNSRPKTNLCPTISGQELLKAVQWEVGGLHVETAQSILDILKSVTQWSGQSS